MIKDLQKKLKGGWESFTTSEQKIAAYLLDNPRAILFETAISLGRRVGVSSMTVGRFLRNLGYAGLNELKEELRDDAAWLQAYRSRETTTDPATMSESLQAEIHDVTAAHALIHTPAWKPIVKLLVEADRVSVASFHQARFLGLSFASLLQPIKPGTRFDEGLDGAYTETLLDSTAKSCVLLIDFRRYSRHFRIVAEEAVARGIPLIIITDSQCYWARQLTEHVLMLPAEMDRPWYSTTGATSLLSLLVGAVSREQGGMFERIGDIMQLRQKLVGYVEAPALDKRASPLVTKGRHTTVTKKAVASRERKAKTKT